MPAPVRNRQLKSEGEGWEDDFKQLLREPSHEGNYKQEDRRERS